MKKTLTILLTIASILLILESFNFYVVFMEFLFVGIIPGSETRLSPTVMLAIVSIITGLILGRVVVLPILKKLEKKTKKPTINRRRLKSV